MLIVEKSFQVEDIVKKSRFIGVIVPCNSETIIRASLLSLSQTHPNASHIAFAYRLKTANGFISRCHDAGEPSGTAGKPIFQQLEGKALINTLIAVIRYFGGIKLGAGGLTRAYGNSAKKVINVAEKVAFVDYVEFKLTLDYAQYQAFEYQLKNASGDIIEQIYNDQIHLKASIPKQHLDLLQVAFPNLITD
jgi:uncharacterized YigZ family protein